MLDLENKFEKMRTELLQENAQLHAERHMGFERPELKSVRFQVSEVSDEHIELMCINVRDRPDVRELKAIRGNIIIVMSENLKKKFQGRTHQNATVWTKFSDTVLDKVREDDDGHAILILGDHRMNG